MRAKRSTILSWVGQARRDLAGEKKTGSHPLLRSSFATEGGRSEVRGQIRQSVVEKERKNDFWLTRRHRFIYRTRYFTDSGIIGGKAFVSATYRKVKVAFQSKRDKIPKPVSGLSGIYSLKRLTE